MTRRLLVVSTVHHPDDNRIRQKLIGTLAADWEVGYATRAPGPSDPTGLTWIELPGGRLRRNLAAARMLMTGAQDVAVVHDPELIPAGLVASRRGRTVVLDVHENVPAQMRTKRWLPRPLRPVLARLAAWTLRAAERGMPITLAESGYAPLFRLPHPVFDNAPIMAELPTAADQDDGSIVYVGDITEIRGALIAVEAAAAAHPPGGLVMIGPCRDELRGRLQAEAVRLGIRLHLPGRLPHPAAMARLATARLALSPLHDVPNYRHSPPTKLLEYAAVGVPCVASDLPATRELVGGWPGVRLVPAGDVAAWRQAVAEGFADLAFRSAAAADRERVRAEHGWPADAVREHYARLSGG